MAHFALRAILFLVGLAVVAGGVWAMHGDPAPAQSTITVKLPPARAADPAPGFAFQPARNDVRG